MEKSSKQSIFKRIGSFIKENVFYLINKEEKDYVRHKVLETDRPIFKKIILIICFIQLIMIVYKGIGCGFVFNNFDKAYLSCYICLILGLLIVYAITESFANAKKPYGYFVTVSLAVLMFSVWASSITVIDALRYDFELTTVAYVSLALTAFICLEPWVIILDLILNFGALLIVVGPVLHKTIYPSDYISLISIFVICIIITITNFMRRVSSFKLQKEITEINIELADKTNIDDLTKTFNRRYLTEHINDLINIGSRPSGVLMIDIDDFKDVNDYYGHQNGDICLKEISKIILESIKNRANSYVVRFGGEEFLVYFPNIVRKDLIDMGEQIRSDIQKNTIKLLDDSEINITVSVGAALAKTGINYSALINQADEKLYVAKNSGKNQVSI